jgi:hypothetical protein
VVLVGTQIVVNVIRIAGNPGKKLVGCVELSRYSVKDVVSDDRVGAPHRRLVILYNVS